MSDPFLKLKRPLWPDTQHGHGALVPASRVKELTVDAGDHSQRAHSKFSASGAERWFNCPGSVALSEGVPDKSSPWAEEGTWAHEVLESFLLAGIEYKNTGTYKAPQLDPKTPLEMIAHAKSAASFILKRHAAIPDSQLLVETRIYLDFIHKEMFGTFDAGIIDYFGTLDVIDFKYGAGVSVSVKENLQMIFYAIGLAHLHQWNFAKVRMWIIQPRIRGYDGPTFWEISAKELKAYVPQFEEAVGRVLQPAPAIVEGEHCRWCKAMPKCPAKLAKRNETAKKIFGVPHV